EYGLMTTVGFPVETTLCVVRLVLTGLYQRHPDFKLLAPHVGATIPFLLERIQLECERYGIGQGSASEQLRRVYLDSVTPSSPPRLDHFAFEVADAESLAEAERRLAVAGVDAAAVDPGDDHAVAAGIRCTLPSGHVMELVLPAGTQVFTPAPLVPGAHHRGIG